MSELEIDVMQHPSGKNMTPMAALDLDRVGQIELQVVHLKIPIRYTTIFERALTFYFSCRKGHPQ